MSHVLLRAVVLGLCLSAAVITPGSAQAKKTAARPSDAAEVTFVGYQALPGGRGLLFVELSRSVEVEVARSGSVIEYKLLGASVPLRNNKNPLLLREFSSSAVSAVLVSSGKGKARAGKHEAPGARLVVTLRGKVEPSHRVVPHGKGAQLEIELPAPSGT